MGEPVLRSALIDRHQSDHDVDKAEISRSSKAILAELGMNSVFTNPEKGASGRRTGKTSEYFERLDLATSTIRLGDLYRTIETSLGFLPPRSAHIGNWEGILRGRAGMLDYNRYICVDRKIGHPLLHVYTQTETTDFSGGDSVYLPGGVVRDGTYLSLPLYSWDGRRFVERDRTIPLACPFVLTKQDGELLPLISYHREQMPPRDQLCYRTEPEAWLANEGLLRQILDVAIDTVLTNRTSAFNLQSVLSGAFSTSGELVPSGIAYDGRGFQVGSTYYRDRAELVDGIIIGLTAAAEPHRVLTEVGSWPHEIPKLSNRLAVLLSALLGLHYPGGAGELEETDGFMVHFHWGGAALAGYPPRSYGYLGRSFKGFRSLCDAIIPKVDGLLPVSFGLLPATCLSLLPAGFFENDVEAVTSLIAAIHENCDNIDETSDSVVPAVEETVERWLQEQRKNLSDYYISRFTHHRSVLNQSGSLPDQGEPVEPIGYLQLTCQQATAAVGALMAALNPA